MKEDLAGVAQTVAAFLGVNPLSPDELAKVLHKCSFEYMQECHDCFEMNPPHIGEVAPRFFVGSRAARLRDIPPEVTNRIARWAEEGPPLTASSSVQVSV
jgi:hypothetical protein